MSVMPFHQAPRPLLQLIATILLAPQFASAVAVPSPAPTAGIPINQLFARDCAPCGYYAQTCCYDGTGCSTDANNWPTCVPTAGGATQADSGGGYWEYWTTTFVETDYVTYTSTYSSYVPGASSTATAVCDPSQYETSCGPICCASDQYCFTSGQCSPAAAAGSSGYQSYYSTSTGIAGAPIRPTTSGTVVITATVSPSTTVPYIAPVPTGANVTVTSGEDNGGGGGLSGGAIAGIVIGVLAGLLLLALLCFYCCVRGLWAACFGGKRRRTEVDEYERRSHHASGGGGRTWYGAARPTTTRVERKESHTGRNLLGVGAGLAALWAILGLKRRRDNRHNEKYSEYSYSSDYYTSASSASSDDRRTRDTRRSISRR